MVRHEVVSVVVLTKNVFFSTKPIVSPIVPYSDVKWSSKNGNPVKLLLMFILFSNKALK